MPVKNIRKILIANRGEIAVRIIRTCREMGIETVAVYSDIDRTALHVRLAENAFPLQGTTSSDTYLQQEKILAVAHQASVDAIHPGYGFLSENPSFAEKVERSGLAFVGPSSSAIRTLGDKTRARQLAVKNTIPVVPGFQDTLNDEVHAAAIANKIGYPILLKAAAGGGGKGMRIVRSASDLPRALRFAQSEAATAFGDDRVYIERFLKSPRHVEIQIIGDHHGNVISLGERDCSVQRRHQKVIEESPSSFIDQNLRRIMSEAAVRLARAAGYQNAGTVEFLIDADHNFYFLEVNTRLQVEHPVTELVMGLDLVKAQIRVAQGEQLPIEQSNIRPSGHAIECRVYAEDPANGFLPSTGILRLFVPPAGPKVRVDSGISEGDEVSIYYDPLLAKVLTWAPTRGECIRAMQRALAEFQLQGVATTIPFCRFVLDHALFQKGAHTTSFVDDHFLNGSLRGGETPEKDAIALCAALLAQRDNQKELLPVNGRTKSPSPWKNSRGDSFRS